MHCCNIQSQIGVRSGGVGGVLGQLSATKTLVMRGELTCFTLIAFLLTTYHMWSTLLGGWGGWGLRAGVGRGELRRHSEVQECVWAVDMGAGAQ